MDSTVQSWDSVSQGFFLVVGPVGQGKTTTLAALIELINTERMEHIVTIEDPIEYIFEPKQSLIDQREVHIDTKDFSTALTSAFRQDSPLQRFFRDMNILATHVFMDSNTAYELWGRHRLGFEPNSPIL